MALATILWSLVLVLVSAGCSDAQKRGKDGANSAAASESARQDSVSTPEKTLVLHARALDRADSLDSAKILYAEAAKRVPLIADWLNLRAAGVTRDKHDRDDLLSHISLPVAQGRKLQTEAIALERSGDVDGAIKAYVAAGEKLSALRLQLLRPADTTSVASARRAIIAFLTASRDRESVREAVALFDKSFTNASPAENLAIARAAFAAGITARALAGYTKAFGAGLGSPRDHFDLGVVFSRLNRDKESIAEFNKVTQPPALVAAARFQAARGMLALGRRDDARSALRQITTAYPSDTSAAAALFLLADLATDDLRDSDARTTLLSVVQRYPTSRQAPAALFAAGLVAFINRDYRTAGSELDSVVSRYPQSDDALASGYWSGRSYKARGDSAGANTRWRAVLAKEKSSYYSVLSAKRLNVPLLADNAADIYPTVPDIDAASKRIAILKDFGMDTEAKFEYDRLFSEAIKSHDRLVATAHALAGTDQSSRSIALGRQAVTEVGPTAQDYRLVYPVLERPTLIQSSKKYNLDPALVASLIKQESNFNPRATSPVGARGLMQLMPPVGRSLASSQRIAGYTDESLYDPAVNIQLGTEHLSGLFRSNSQVERVLAAYNAGESRVAKWIQKAGANDPELFTERIPFVETRDYVRSIVRNRAFYSRLYSW